MLSRTSARILLHLRPAADTSAGFVGSPLPARADRCDRESPFEIQDPAQPARVAHSRLADGGVPGRPARASSQSDKTLPGLRCNLLPLGTSGRIPPRVDA